MVMRSPTRGLCLGGKSHYLMGGGGGVEEFRGTWPLIK